MRSSRVVFYFSPPLFGVFLAVLFVSLFFIFLVVWLFLVLLFFFWDFLRFFFASRPGPLPLASNSGSSMGTLRVLKVLVVGFLW